MLFCSFVIVWCQPAPRSQFHNAHEQPAFFIAQHTTLSGLNGKKRRVTCRCGVPGFSAHSHDPWCRAQAASIVAAMSGQTKHESLFVVCWGRHAPVGLEEQPQVCAVLLPVAEKQLVALCETNVLADAQLCFDDVKEAIEELLCQEVIGHCGVPLFGSTASTTVSADQPLPTT